MKNNNQKIAFTICSINYLAQAIALGNSLTSQNADYDFKIGLVDKVDGYQTVLQNIPYELIEVENIQIPNFNSFCDRYNITELNTAVKPFFFEYLFSNNPVSDIILYLDPDIYVYDKFEALEAGLSDNQIILTPHATSPITDDKYTKEMDFLNTGIYNLGFIGMRRGEESFKLIKWWQERLRDYCYVDFEKGLFVDQIWINLAPLFFKKVFILFDLGYNIAYWNLHERSLVKQSDGKYFVNNNYPLVFYHFSGYNLDKVYEISKYQNRNSFSTRPELADLFDAYNKSVMALDHRTFQNIPCYFVQQGPRKKISFHIKLGRAIKTQLHKIINSK